MPAMMEGKVAVVTGAGGGIGREIAIMMAGQGAKVIIADIGASLSGEGGSASPAEQTKALIAQNGGVSEICTESVSTWDSARKIIQSAMDHFGRIDAVPFGDIAGAQHNAAGGRRVGRVGHVGCVVGAGQIDGVG